MAEQRKRTMCHIFPKKYQQLRWNRDPKFINNKIKPIRSPFIETINHIQKARGKRNETNKKMLSK
jgi:hypothetical protein